MENKVQLYINNAGIVILSTYIPILFDRLGLTSNKKFTSAESQMNATQILQYVVTGINNTDPTYLQLNKILCGLPITHQIPLEIEINHENEQLVTSLINATISHWPAIGQFFGGWLSGKLAC